MKIGVMVYSQTGHTLSVAEKLRQKLAADGHAVTVEQVEPAGPVSPSAVEVELKTVPAVDVYAALVFCCPVIGGRPAAPMASYLQQLPSLEGRPVACLVTGFFPPNVGRNQTLARMRELCESKGAVVRGTGSVGWFSLWRKRQIWEVVDALSAAF